MPFEICTHCEAGFIEKISHTDFISEGNPRSYFFECDYCNGKGFIISDEDQRDNLNSHQYVRD